MAKQKIDREFVKKLAEQAKLRLTDAELDTYTQQFKGIVDQIDQLQAIDTEGVKPTYMVVEPENAMREDEPDPARTITGEQLLNLAPNRQGGYILSKKVLDK